MKTAPLLLLAYNRPDKFSALLSSLKPLKPSHVVVVVDGPKKWISDDAERVSRVVLLAKSIDWVEKLEVVVRESNIGLRASVTDAVTSIVREYGRVIVLEDDARPSIHFLPFMNHMLDLHENSTHIEHISGYNPVPLGFIQNFQSGTRLSRYPESYAWATWDRAWNNFDESLKWALNTPLSNIARITGSTISALRWKQNFYDASSGRISTWAYRWLASMWSRDAFMLTPNHNLVTYTGYDSGTHTFMKAGWSELPLFDGEFSDLIAGIPIYDKQADHWAGKYVYAETIYGVIRGIAVSIVLEIRKIIRKFRNNSK